MKLYYEILYKYYLNKLRKNNFKINIILVSGIQLKIYNNIKRVVTEICKN